MRACRSRRAVATIAGTSSTWLVVPDVLEAVTA